MSATVQPAHPLLLLDVGNSRLKWALTRSANSGRGARSGPVIRASGSFAVAALRRSSAPLSRVLRQSAPDALIYVCSVASPNIERRIRAAAAALGRRRPRFIRTEHAAAGVSNGYVEAWRLGVDRWVALIGAHHRYSSRNLCIVSIGSAMTIDLLASDGRHQGGSITPSPYLMLETLLRGTAGIRRRAGASSAASLTASRSSGGDEVPGSLFAHDTRSAVLSGCLRACAELIERALIEGRQRLGTRPQLLVTGGGADSVLPLLRSGYRRDEDLVLHGLLVLASLR